MARFVPCPSCGRHVRHVDARCPFCGHAEVDSPLPARLSALLLGLCLAGCAGSGSSGDKTDKADGSEPAPQPAVNESGNDEAAAGEESGGAATTDGTTTDGAPAADTGDGGDTTDGAPAADTGDTGNTGTDDGSAVGPKPVVEPKPVPKPKYGAPRPAKKYGGPPMPGPEFE
ncbi:MAG: hypothetical protein KC431_06285 [Myxococcales bacterium]|nr:hypothetical protein [Myxococcales bacterium]